MVTIIQQEDAALSYDNVEHDNGVLQSYDSIDSLIDNIKATASNMFEALSLVNEVNYLSGYKLIGEYEIANIKKHFRNIEISNIKSGILEKDISQNEKCQIKVDNTERGNVKNDKSKMRNLKKGYMKLLSV